MILSRIPCMSEASHVRRLIPMRAKHTVVILLFTDKLSQCMCLFVLYVSIKMWMNNKYNFKLKLNKCKFDGNLGFSHLNSALKS